MSPPTSPPSCTVGQQGAYQRGGPGAHPSQPHRPGCLGHCGLLCPLVALDHATPPTTNGHDLLLAQATLNCCCSSADLQCNETIALMLAAATIHQHIELITLDNITVPVLDVNSRPSLQSTRCPYTSSSSHTRQHHPPVSSRKTSCPFAHWLVLVCTMQICITPPSACDTSCQHRAASSLAHCMAHSPMARNTASLAASTIQWLSCVWTHAHTTSTGNRSLMQHSTTATHWVLTVSSMSASLQSTSRLGQLALNSQNATAHATTLTAPPCHH